MNESNTIQVGHTDLDLEPIFIALPRAYMTLTYDEAYELARRITRVTHESAALRGVLREVCQKQKVAAEKVVAALHDLDPPVAPSPGQRASREKPIPGAPAQKK